ncbi:hypothetical protein RSOL_507110, partial [Rhizoctonia solani AG-3 Rhs1AP]
MASAVVSPHSSLNTPLTQSRAEVVQRCASGIQTTLKDWTAPRVLLFDDYVVKFNQEDRCNEADTQAFVYEAFKNSPNAPRIPEVYDCFTWDHWQYFVMERVHLPTVQHWLMDAVSEADQQSRFETACQLIANALRSLFTLSPPPDAEIGLIKGAYAHTLRADVCARSGCAIHPFFGSFTAPFRYTGAPALERHINRSLTYRPGTAPRLEVSMSDEPLVMVQSEIAPDKFLIDPETQQLTMIDFGHVSALPHSFVSYTLHVCGDKFTAEIAKYLDWERSNNRRPMAAAARIYMLSCSKRFGLDKDGYPQKPAPRPSQPLCTRS